MIGSELAVFNNRTGKTIITRWNSASRRFETVTDGAIELKAAATDRSAKLLCTLCGHEMTPTDTGNGTIAKEPVCGGCIRTLISPDAHLGAVEAS